MPDSISLGDPRGSSMKMGRFKECEAFGEKLTVSPPEELCLGEQNAARSRPLCKLPLRGKHIWVESFVRGTGQKINDSNYDQLRYLSTVVFSNERFHSLQLPVKIYSLGKKIKY